MNSPTPQDPVERFAFGENWSKFLGLLTEDRIRDAERALSEMLQRTDLRGLRFLDAGSGSGLSSLAARRLGATVHSFDFDPRSVACTAELRRRYTNEDPQWTVERGSVLDQGYMKGLGEFDISYSWGVAHHTGHMWQAIDNVLGAVKQHGSAFIAIYNDQGWISNYWRTMKQAYVRTPVLRWPLLALHAPYLVGGPLLVRTLTGRLRLSRGMSYLRDLEDWVGGFPFEVARPEQVVDFCRDRGFMLVKLRTVGGRLGCNEFVFQSRDDRT